MSEQNGDSSDFKVLDRRSFHSDGSRREEKIHTPEAEPPSEPAAPEPSPEVSSTEIPPEKPPLGPVNFEGLVYSLSTTALFQLGVMEGPEGERIPADLPNARRTIDILNVLKEKTQGNLTSKESKLLTDVLYELQMTYVTAEGGQAK